MKGVFGEGASVLVVPESARAANAQQARAAQIQAQEQRAQRQELTPEQLQRRAQSRGLWTDGGELPTAPSSQPKAGTLPRAVVGTPSPVAANTNYRSPSIGNTDSQPAAAPPLAAAAAAVAHTGALDTRTLSTPVRAPSLPAEADFDDTGDTMEIPMEKVLGKLPPQAAKPAPASEPAAAPARAKPAGSPPNTTLWLALILIAAVVAVLFIGAAVGLWRLPWSRSSAGRSGLNKAIPAKSLPEMRAAAPEAAPPQPVAAAPAVPAALAAPAPLTAAAPAAAPEVEAAPANAPVMEAEEAAPLRAPALSSGNLDDLMDPPSPEVAPTLTAARAEVRAGRPKQAEAMLRPLLETNPDDHHVNEAMAQALLARGAAVEAVGYAQRIVKKRPKRASYRVLLGDALRRAGDEPSAKLAYKDALALDPKMREAQRRLKSRAEPKKLAPTP